MFIIRYAGEDPRKRAGREQENATVLQLLGFLVGHSRLRVGDGDWV
jgi:hypothetical protein